MAVGKGNTKERLNMPSLVKKWIILIVSIVIVWVLAIWFIPIIGERVPILSDIVKVAKERQINVGAYFYTEIEESYEGEYHLKNSTLGKQDNIVSWLISISGILVCLVILYVGYIYLPR